MGRHHGGPLTADERRIVAAWSAETHQLAGIDVPSAQILAMLAASSAGRAKLRGLIHRNTARPKPSPRPYPSLERTGPRDEVAEARVIKALEKLRNHAAQ